MRFIGYFTEIFIFFRGDSYRGSIDIYFRHAIIVSKIVSWCQGGHNGLGQRHSGCSASGSSTTHKQTRYRNRYYASGRNYEFEGTFVPAPYLSKRFPEFRFANDGAENFSPQPVVSEGKTDDDGKAEESTGGVVKKTDCNTGGESTIGSLNPLSPRRIV